MRSKPLTVGGLSFGSQNAANQYIKDLLHGQPLSTPIAGPNHSFLCALLSRHPRAAEKTGMGIRHFTVEPAAYGTRCFHLTRVDGTKIDFSTFKCVRGQE